MLENKAILKVNANFHHASGEDLFVARGERFSEYRHKWEMWPKGFQVGKFPLFLDIEVTSACNLFCPFCATTYRGNKIKKGFVAFDTVKRIIDEGADNGLYGVKFNIRGEPLLHNQIHDFVKYAKNRGLIDVYFNTNGMLLSKEISQKLIDSRLDRLTVSAEGFTKEIYERYRVGAKFETLLTNIKNMQVLKKESGVGHPKIRIQSVILPELEPVLSDYKDFWSEKADEVAFLDYKEMKLKKVGVRYPWACPQLWQRMAIWWDGTILPCNHDDEGLMALGNVEKTTIKKAWNSKWLNNARDLHRNREADKIAACDGCYLRDSEIGKLMNKREQT